MIVFLANIPGLMRGSASICRGNGVCISFLPSGMSDDVRPWRMIVTGAGVVLGIGVLWHLWQGEGAAVVDVAGHWLKYSCAG